MERGNLLNPAMSLLCKRFWPWRHASFPSDPAEFSHCSADHFLCFCRGNFCWQIDQSLLQEAAIVLWKNPQEWWELFTVGWSWKAKAFSGNPPGKYPRCSSARWVWGLAERGSESKATCTVNKKMRRIIGIFFWFQLEYIQKFEQACVEYNLRNDQASLCFCQKFENVFWLSLDPIKINPNSHTGFWNEFKGLKLGRLKIEEGNNCFFLPVEGSHEYSRGGWKLGGRSGRG